MNTQGPHMYPPINAPASGRDKTGTRRDDDEDGEVGFPNILWLLLLSLTYQVAQVVGTGGLSLEYVRLAVIHCETVRGGIQLVENCSPVRLPKTVGALHASTDNVLNKCFGRCPK